MNVKDELRRLCAEGGSHARIKYLRNKMKRATIAELRKLLRERGVRFNEFKLMTQWVGALGESVEAYTTDTFPDTLLVKHAYLTPEQAIEVTLGRGTCHVEGYDDGEDELLDGTWVYRVPTWHLSCGHEVHGTHRPCFCPRCCRRIKEV